MNLSVSAYRAYYLLTMHSDQQELYFLQALPKKISFLISLSLLVYQQLLSNSLHWIVMVKNYKISFMLYLTAIYERSRYVEFRCTWHNLSN
jgi:hypothetical protein